MKNWYKIAQEKVFYVMRGVSGSGKSTQAKSLPGVVPDNIFSTDALISDNLEEYNAFFDQMQENDDWSPLVEKHKQLIQMVTVAMDNGSSPLVLDNMNLKAWESKTLVQAAVDRGYRVEFVDVGTGGLTVDQLAARNRHGVDREMLQKMVDKYTEEGPLTVDKVLESVRPENI